jgi:hypothetical protein
LAEHEPLQVTLVRTGGIALVVGLVVAASRSAQITGRLLIWLVGGVLLMIGARITASALGTPSMRLPPWWLGGPAFVGLELLVHALLQLRGQPNFYNGLR